MKNTTKKPVGWSTVRQHLTTWEKPELLALVKDLYEVAAENRDFIQARCSESPVSGTLPGDNGKQVLVIRFTSSLVPGPGEYLGWLHLTSNDPVNPVREIPVRMVVFTCGVALSPPSQSGWGAAGERVEYLLHLTNEGSAADVFTLTSNGSLWVVDLTPYLAGLGAGKSLPVTVAVTIPAGTPPGVMDDLVIAARSQGDPSKISEVILNTLAAYHLFLPLISR